MLFHISEAGDIRYFEPRGAQGTEGPAVWADAVVASSLQFSMIRMRNALPREEST
jgi:hypothetical protein